MALKRCSKCRELKPHSEFYKNKRSNDGLSGYCKICMIINTKKYQKTKNGKLNHEYLRQKARDEGYFTFGNGAITRLRQASKSRSHTFDLTQDQLEQWWESTDNKCHYCGITVTTFIKLRDAVLNSDESNYHVYKFRSLFGEKHKKISEMTIDRLDNEIGYELNNMVKCCWFCNNIKGSILTPEDMKLIAPEIIFRLKTHL